MALYLGDTKIKELYLGNTKIKEAYLGSTLVYKSTHYDPDEVVFESSTPGQYTLDLLDNGKYEVICIAGGGGGYSAFPYFDDNYYFGGGSGSGFDCVLQLTAGSYTVVVGAGGVKQGGASAGDSQFGTSYAYKGGNGTAKYAGMGAAGASPAITYTIVSTIFNKAGNAGTRDRNSAAAGGASVYDNTTTGYGAGGRSNINGYAGYVKVIYKGR